MELLTEATGPDFHVNRLTQQREAAYQDMMRVAARLLREGYPSEADRVLDFIAERKATKLWPEEYIAWLREMEPLHLGEPGVTDDEIEAVQSVLERRVEALRH